MELPINNLVGSEADGFALASLLDDALFRLEMWSSKAKIAVAFLQQRLAEMEDGGLEPEAIFRHTFYQSLVTHT